MGVESGAVKIPTEFHRELWRYVVDEELHRVPTPSPDELARLAGKFCRRWFACDDFPLTHEGWQLAELVAYSERLGKHVGVFFHAEKEG